jgi:thiosulfate dehydrogenase [quinone] large subunit
MTAVLNTDNLPGRQSLAYSDRSLRRLHGAALVRIFFGLLWAADATFKWLPGFIHGQTVTRDLNPAAVPTPVIHQWLELWHSASAPDPAAMAVAIAVTETLIALGMIFGVFSNLVFVGSAVYSFGLWTTPEHIHLPWMSGNTDLGPSGAYMLASLALLCAAAGATWSVDAVIRPRLGRFAPLAGSAPAA